MRRRFDTGTRPFPGILACAGNRQRRETYHVEHRGA